MHLNGKYKHARVRTAAAARGECRWRRKGSERRLLEGFFFFLPFFFLPVSFLITNGAPHHGGEAVEKGGGSAACIWLLSHAVSFPASAAAAGPMQIIYRQIEAFWRAAARINPDLLHAVLRGNSAEFLGGLQLRHAYHL
ncbi:hypothetical protein V8C43DRAFT_256424 [Trichoderma afarasin]